jgi:sulfur carrier protein
MRATEEPRLSVRVNGTARVYRCPLTLAELVAQWTNVPFGCAAAVNGTVVPRSAWQDRQIEDGDGVEIVSAQPGG